jgi:hypothetical protein
MTENENSDFLRDHEFWKRPPFCQKKQKDICAAEDEKNVS